jgi:hypothetical protein
MQNEWPLCVHRAGTATACRQGLSVPRMRTISQEMQRHEGVREGETVMTTITRNEVARMLRVSVATVRRMEGKSLHPRLIDGAWRFEVDEVNRIQRASNSVSKRVPSEGQIAAEIFRRFDEGQSLRQIVRECRQLPKVVQALYEEWNTPLGHQAGCDDESAIFTRDEEDIVRWEEAMRAMIAADERRELQV